MLAWGEHSSRPVNIISVLGQSVPAGMPCQHDIFFHAEPLISRFSSEIYITLLQQLWQTVLVWNLYPIGLFILLNQLAVKITPAESFLWMHLHQFQYLLYIKPGIVQMDSSENMLNLFLECWENIYIWLVVALIPRNTLFRGSFWNWLDW